ncbi:hypothetical protein T484DRAFT_1933020 [Baffinella frigidus]|nr:hypothetical protein T484DRAFT_1933020 [Cryptophyta sp. CCMP2293]|mmetsp:Transcript_38810/g.91650  ORF Transcript_38810/g.91650 Transcript_38810/m.91650 type:complete len:136 (+) Transcript_38810:33-440(+)
MRGKTALFSALVVLFGSFAAGEGTLAAGYCCVRSRTRMCGWGEMTGEHFSDFVTHVRNSHRVGVRLGGGALDEPNWCYCQDCPDSKDEYGTQLRNPNAVLKHLREIHGIRGSSLPVAPPASPLSLNHLIGMTIIR